MAYTESLFLFLTLSAFLGMLRRWPLLLIAIMVGLATATRPVGLALLVPFALHLWVRSRTSLEVVASSLVYLPLACWGLGAFSLYQYQRFGDFLAFSRTQEHWRMRPATPPLDKLIDLATLEPVWSVFVASSPCSLVRYPAGYPVLLGPELMNRCFFLLIVALVLLGIARRWINASEASLAAGLLLIPYLTRAQEMCMASSGRFAVVVFPAFLVAGHLLARLPLWSALSVFLASAALLGVYSSLFVAGWSFY
jgi:hypothetical protein